jgi:hypothetical protein
LLKGSSLEFLDAQQRCDFHDAGDDKAAAAFFAITQQRQWIAARQ